MTTLGTMVARIGSEINRTDIDSNIYDAIVSAIGFYESKEFYFNQATGTLTTTANLRYTALSSVPDFLYPLILRATDATGQYRVIEQSPYTEIEQYYNSDSSTGFIYDYAIFAENFWWRLIPDSSYPINVSYIKELDKPSNSTDTEHTSSWFIDAEALIRAKAKAYTYIDVLKNEEEATKFEGVAKSEYGQLLEKTRKRSYNAKITGWM